MKYFLSSAAIVALSFLAVGCSNDDAVVGTTEGQFTTFVGGMSSAPTTRVQLNENGSVSASTLTELTRTSMDRTATGQGGDFSWEKGDKIWVKNVDKWEQCANVVDAKKERFEFLVGGSYTADSYNVYYTGTNSPTPQNDTDPIQVLISEFQTQSEFNNTEHFGASGDCGVAKATKGTNGIYNFNVDHKAAYLCLLPYSTDATVRNDYKIKKVAFVSGAAVAGTYTLTETGLDVENGTGTSKTVTLNAGTDGFALTDCTAADINKSLYMVVAPSTGYFRVDVTLSKDGKESLISKTFSTVELKPNTIYDIPLNLTFESSTTTLFNYPNEKYEMWDKDKTIGCPNLNEMAWYMRKGDVMYDDNTLWTAPDGQTYTGGIWLKRRAVIQKDNNLTEDSFKNTSPDKDYYADMVNNNLYSAISKTIPANKPTADKIKDYFFIPALGAISSTGLVHKYGQYGFFYGCDNNPNVQYSVTLFCFWSNYNSGHVLKLAYEKPTVKCIINKNFFK